MVKPDRFSPISNAITAALSFAIGVVWLASGCATQLTTIDTGRHAFFRGDLETATQSLSKIADGRNRFAAPAGLDLAIVELASGDAGAAARRLRELRDRFDENSDANEIGSGGSVVGGAKKLGGEALSMVTDDTARMFRPTGYEEVMIRTVLSMCSLVTEDGDAESYINQAAMHQAKLRSVADARQKQFFPDVTSPSVHQELALAPYLRGVLREATHHDFDDAKRNYQLVSSIKPDFRPAIDDLNRATVGNHSRPGHGVVYVFALVGRGPVLVPVDAPVTSVAVSIASTLMLYGDEREDNVIRLPKITSVKIPSVVVPDSPIAAVAVSAQVGPAEFQNLGATQSLTDVAELVRRQADAEQPWTIARSFVRQAGKELAVAKAREGLGLDGGIGTAFQFATSTAWTAAETADTRCWGLLPREIQVLRAELPVGNHPLYLAPVGGDGFSIGPERVRHVTIENGRNTYVVLIAPAQHMYLVNSR